MGGKIKTLDIGIKYPHIQGQFDPNFNKIKDFFKKLISQKSSALNWTVKGGRKGWPPQPT